MRPTAPGRRGGAAGRGTGVMLVSVLALGGCGYTIGGTLPEHIRTVAVPIFVNKTTEPAVENTITQAVVNAFVAAGRVRVVPREEADALLEGEITGYVLSPISVVTGQTIAQYRLQVTMNLTFRDLRRNALLRQQQGLSEQADFRVFNQVAGTIAREEVAVGQAAVQIGRKVVSLAMDRF